MKLRDWNSVDEWRQAWADRLGLTIVKTKRLLTLRMLEQLERCRDDDARKVLLGITE